MNTTHTQEPWEVVYDEVEECFHIGKPDPLFGVIYIARDLIQGKSQGGADASRIVECVNACAGIENPTEFIKEAARRDVLYTQLIERVKLMLLRDVTFDFKKKLHEIIKEIETHE